jgi:hypothetical protein
MFGGPLSAAARAHVESRDDPGWTGPLITFVIDEAEARSLALGVVPPLVREYARLSCDTDWPRHLTRRKR